MSNDRRVALAAKALAVVKEDKYQDDATTLVDLLADLMHWAVLHDTNFDDCLRIARNHHFAETHGEE